MALRNAEALRSRLWRLSARTSLGRRCLRERRTRLAVLASLHLVVAFSLTLAAPLWLLLLGPLLLGVPHVIGDIRFLLLGRHRRVTQRAAVALLIPLGVMTALRVGVLLGAPVHLAWELAFGSLAMAAGVCFAPVGMIPRGLALLCVAGLAAVLQIHPSHSTIIIAHLHNGVAFGLWLWWMREEGRLGQLWWLVALYVGLIALLLLGVADPLLGDAMGWDRSVDGLDFAGLTWTLAPELPYDVATRLVLVYAFAQAVHYSVWIRLAPQSPPFYAREGAPSIRRSWENLRQDLGRWGLRLACGAVLLVPVMALFDPYGVRSGYLTVVLFHGWLELAVVAHLLARRQRSKAS